jgi:hypothetical protein
MKKPAKAKAAKKPAGDYLLRNFPADLKAKAQHLAIDSHMSLRELILAALENYCTAASTGQLRLLTDRK